MNNNKTTYIEKIAHIIQKVESIDLSYYQTSLIIFLLFFQDHTKNPFFKTYYLKNEEFFIFQDFSPIRVIYTLLNRLFLQIIFIILFLNSLYLIYFGLWFKQKQLSFKKPKSVNDRGKFYHILFYLSFSCLIFLSELIEIYMSLLKCNGNIINDSIVMNNIFSKNFCSTYIYTIIQIFSIILIILNYIYLLLVINFFQPRIDSKMKLFNRFILLENIILLKKFIYSLNHVISNSPETTTLYFLNIALEFCCLIIILNQLCFKDITITRQFTYFQSLSLLFNLCFYYISQKVDGFENKKQSLYIVYILIPMFLYLSLKVIWNQQDNTIDLQLGSQKNMNSIFKTLAQLKTIKDEECILIKHRLICKDEKCVCKNNVNVTLKQIIQQQLKNQIKTDLSSNNYLLLISLYIEENNYKQVILLNIKVNNMILSLFTQIQLRALELKIHQLFYEIYKLKNYEHLEKYFYSIEMQNDVQNIIQQILQEYKKIVERIGASQLDSNSFYNYAKKIKLQINNLIQNYAREDSPLPILQACFIFYVFFLNDTRKAQECYRQIKKNETQLAENTDIKMLGLEENFKDSFFVSNELGQEREGIITNLGGNVQKLLETNKVKLIGKTIQDLLPRCIREDHAESLLKYRYQQIEDIDKFHQNTVISNNNEIIFFANLYIKYRQDIQNNKIELKTLVSKSQEQCIIIDEFGIISNFSEDFKICFRNNQELFLKEGLFVFTMIPQLLELILDQSIKFRQIFDPKTLPNENQKLYTKDIQNRIRFAEINTKDLKKYNRQTSLEKFSIDYDEFWQYYQQYKIEEDNQQYMGFTLDIRFDFIPIYFSKNQNVYYLIKINSFQQTKRFSNTQFNMQKSLLQMQIRGPSGYNLKMMNSKENMLHSQQLNHKKTTVVFADQLDQISLTIIQEENQRKNSFFDFKQQFITYNKSQISKIFKKISFSKIQFYQQSLFLIFFIYALVFSTEIYNNVKQESNVLEAIQENKAIIVHYNNFFFSYNFLTMVIKLCRVHQGDLISSQYLDHIDAIQSSVYDSIPIDNISSDSKSMGKSLYQYIDYIMSLKGKIMRIQFNNKHVNLTSVNDCIYYDSILQDITDQDTVEKFYDFFSKFDFAEFYWKQKRFFLRVWIIVVIITSFLIVFRMFIKYSFLNDLGKIINNVIQTCQKKHNSDDFYNNHDKIFYYLSNIFFGIQYKTSSSDLNQSTMISQSTNHSLFIFDVQRSVKKMNYFKYKVFENIFLSIPLILLFIFQWYYLGFQYNDIVKYFENQQKEYLQILKFININQKLIDYVFEPTNTEISSYLKTSVSNYDSISRIYFESSIFQDLQQQLSILDTQNTCQIDYIDALSNDIKQYCINRNLVSSNDNLVLNFAKSELIITYQNKVTETFSQIEKLNVSFADQSEEIKHLISNHIFDILILIRMIILFKGQIEMPFQYEKFHAFFSSKIQLQVFCLMSYVVIIVCLVFLMTFIDENVKKRKKYFWWFIKKNRNSYNNILQKNHLQIINECIINNVKL